MDDHEIVSKLVFAALCTASNKEWLPTVIRLSGDIQQRLAAREAVANAARSLVAVNDGFMDTQWQAQQWGPLEKALEALDNWAAEDAEDAARRAVAAYASLARDVRNIKLETVANAAQAVRFRPDESNVCWDILADALDALDKEA